MSSTHTTWERRISVALAVPGGIILFGMMFYVTANALSRAFASNPLPLTLELTQYWAMPILAALGFVTAQLAGQHIAADLFFGMFPERGRRLLLVGMDVVCGLLALIAAWFTWGEASGERERGTTAGATDLVTWPPYMILALGLAGLGLLLLLAAVQAARAPLTHGDAPAESPGADATRSTEEDV